MRHIRPARVSTPLPRLDQLALACAGGALALAGCGPSLDVGDTAQPVVLAQSAGAEAVRVELEVPAVAPPPTTVVVTTPPVVEPAQVVYVRPAEQPEPVYVVPPPTQRPVHLYVPPTPTAPVPVINVPVPTAAPPRSYVPAPGELRSVGPLPLRVRVAG